VADSIVVMTLLHILPIVIVVQDAKQKQKPLENDNFLARMLIIPNQMGLSQKGSLFFE